MSRHILAHYEGANQQGEPPPWPQLLVPVPLHWRRRWWRGFNQAQWLANRILRQLHQSSPRARQRAHDFPDLKPGHCRRIRHTPNQRSLTQRHRRHNLDQAFEIPIELEGQTIALLDDVVTTGSTVAEISRLLSAAGAGNIAVWSLCRTSLTPRSGPPLE